MRDHEEVGAVCGTCKLCSHVCGQSTTCILLLSVILANAALGVLLILREQILYLLPDVHFTSHTAFGWAVGLGGLMCVVAFYGLISIMPFCDFDTVNHRKLYGLVSAGLAILLLLAAAVTASYVGNTMELTAELRYGWHAAYTGKSPATGITKAQGKVLIREAQRDLQCCGFGHTTKEQSIAPCGSAAHFGCETPLLAELQESLLWLAGLEAGGALFALFALAVVACNAEAARDAMNRGEAPGGGKSGGRRAQRPHNPHEVIYPPVMGHFVAGGGPGPGGLLPGGGVGWDEHALVGGARSGAASMTSANTSEPGARAITHRSGVF